MYNYERLSDDIKIAVSSDHTFGTDAVLLSDFAKIKARDKALDIQKNAYEQVCHSIELNGLESRIKAYNCDLRKINEVFGAEQFSLVTMNPPYKPVGTGIESLCESARIARHEVCCNIEDACKAASYLLKYAGRFCMCHRPERLVDTLELMRKYKIEPKRLRFVQDKTGEQPFLFLVQGQKGAKPFLRVEPQLIIKKDNGKFTPEMLDIYGSYADGFDK